MSEISVAVFAGGKSLRFGSPKINAKINGREFGEIIFNTLRVRNLRKFFLSVEIVQMLYVGASII